MAAIRNRDYVVAFRIWRPEAQKGVTSAEAGLGYLYAAGLGVDRDPKLAIHWLSLAAAKGHPRAQFDLAQVYHTEAGVRDYSKAASLYRIGARRGWGMARIRLADLYANGRGVPRNSARAYVWIILAAEVAHTNPDKIEAEQNEATARNAARQLREKMNPAEKNAADDVLRQCRAAIGKCK
ncbi:MAG TPA: tetratricopeptide repeat protein [Rhizomicrobium sp.]|nr:tetratricopeptide repeat protein [Rhizomicrobium sp.]